MRPENIGRTKEELQPDIVEQCYSNLIISNNEDQFNQQDGKLLVIMKVLLQK
jgi:hypothetical protein